METQAQKFRDLSAREAPASAFVDEERLQGTPGERLADMAQRLGHGFRDFKCDFHMRLPVVNQRLGHFATKRQTGARRVDRSTAQLREPLQAGNRALADTVTALGASLPNLRRFRLS